MSVDLSVEKGRSLAVTHLKSPCEKLEAALELAADCGRITRKSEINHTTN
jgi:hypothetical protein